MFGLSPKVIKEIHGYLAELPTIEKVLLYGSRAKGSHRPGSDIDLTLLGKGLTQENSLLPLMRKLDESSLPYLFDISIFAQLSSPNLIEHILRVGKVFYLRAVKLPDHWEVRMLGDLCDIFNGSTPSRRNKDFWENGTINWFTVDDIRNQGRRIQYTSQTITKLGLEKSSLKLLPPKSVLICCTASVGECAITEIELTTNQQFNGLVVKNTKQLNNQFLYYFITTLKSKLLGISGKTTIDFVSMTKLRKIEIPVPPLPEQEAIVAILDQAFAAIDQAKAKLERNIANAKELFQSKLNAIFSQKGEGWVETTLGEVTGGISTGPFGSLLHKSDYVQNGIPLINPAHITETGIKPDPQKTVTIETAERLRNYKLVKGDIIIGRRGEMGRCAIVTENEEGWLCGTGSFTIKSSKKIESEYLVRLLRSDVIREKLEFIAGGAVMKNLNNKSLSNFVIKIPSISAQKIAISQFNSLCSASRQLEALYILKITMLYELKKSILQKAFSGQFTTSEELSA